MTDITPDDVRTALLRMAEKRAWCELIAFGAFDGDTVLRDIQSHALGAAHERAACAAEARAEGDR